MGTPFAYNKECSDCGRCDKLNGKVGSGETALSKQGAQLEIAVII